MDFHTIINSQRDYFNTNKTKEVQYRIKQLKKLKSVLKESETDLYTAIFNDFGKSEFETFTSELSFIYHEIDNFLHNYKSWTETKRVSTGLMNFPAKSYIIPEPLGVTLIIGAWNYPYQLSLAPAVASLAAGNTVLVKPSEIPSETSAIMAKLINENFDANYLHVVEGGVAETTELLKHRFDKIFFTGSTKVGKIIYKAAAEHLTPVTLELGGKSPTFILDDTNIQKTAKRIVWAKFLNAGQTCVAPDYILVDKKIESKILQALKKEIETHYTGTEKAEENYLQIINEANFSRLVEVIDEDKIYFGGKSDAEKRIISPTLLSNTTFEDKVMQDEIFGPILPIISYTNLDEAIAQVKSRAKPLSCYIYSKSSKKIKKILHEVSFGGGAVNESVMHLTNSELPFGGVGMSGFGSYHGKTGFDNFSHTKSILHKSFWLETKLKYAPYTSLKKKIVKWILR